jgi:hypothetical protein
VRKPEKGLNAMKRKKTLDERIDELVAKVENQLGAKLQDCDRDLFNGLLAKEIESDKDLAQEVFEKGLRDIVSDHVREFIAEKLANGEIEEVSPGLYRNRA